MKIIYLANIRMPTEKAHGVQIMKMCEAFSRAGTDVNLIVSDRRTPIKKDPFSYYGVEKEFFIKRITSLDFVKFGKIGFTIQSFSFAISSLLYVMNREGIIYSRDPLPLYLLSFFRKDIFWEIHTKQDNFMARRLLKKANGVIPITKGLRDFYEKKLGKVKSILVSPDAVDLKDFELCKTKEGLRKELNLPLNKKIVGYIGKMKTMGEVKGVEGIMEVFPDILKKNPDAFLLLVGANSDELNELTKILAEKGISEESYKIVEHVSRVSAVGYMKTSDILVMNYPNTEHYAYYMSPLKMFEYMASGAVIITTDLPSIREILDEKSAIFVKPDDNVDLLNKINGLLSNWQTAKAVSESSLSLSRHFTWDKRAKDILSFISGVARER